MKTSVLLLFLILSYAQYSFGQINPSLNDKEKDKINLSNDFKMDFSKYKLNNFKLQNTPNLVIKQDLTVHNAFKKDFYWEGSTQSQTFDYQNLKFETQYQFDINGNLKRSSMSVKLKN